jgi:hypothetical protein
MVKSRTPEFTTTEINNREVDRQIAIAFHKDINIVNSKRGGYFMYLGTKLAAATWDETSADKLIKCGWESCWGNIWATHDLPRYTQDLNLVIHFLKDHLLHSTVEFDKKVDQWVALFDTRTEDATSTAYQYCCAYADSPAEAICRARLTLKKDYGI